MTEETRPPYEGSETTGEEAPKSGTSSSTSENWSEVGRQFQALGETLAETVRAAWQNEETQRTVQDMRSGLESMVQKVGKAIDESASSPQGQRIRQGVEQTAQSLRSAGEQTVQEVRPQLINALQQVNAELQKLIDRMEKRSGAESAAEAGAPPPPPQNPSDDSNPT